MTYAPMEIGEIGARKAGFVDGAVLVHFPADTVGEMKPAPNGEVFLYLTPEAAGLIAKAHGEGC